MASKAKKVKYLRDEPLQGGGYVRAWKEGRGHGEYVVQVWKINKPEGEPDGDWVMPGVLGLEISVQQAVLNTGL